VAVAVAGQFVAAGDDGTDQLRVTLGDPAQREEGRLHVTPGQHVEDAADIALDPAFARVPLVAADVRREGGDLEVVLHVDGQRIRDHGREHGR